MEPSPLSLKMPAEVTEKLFKQQKRELAILNAIIQTLSSSYNLKETLETALAIVLSVVESQTGWICLLDENNSCAAFVGYKGLCFTNEQGEPTPCLVNCVCGRVRKTRDIVVIKKLRKGCPLLRDANQSLGIIGHVSVPLTAKSRVVGQLNVSFSDTRQADEMDIDLLKTIAPQLAVAIENARLWEQVQEKEKLRKQLLRKVVAAQEDERRRISRELHDELGQEMTSLLVRLQVLEKVGPCPQSEEIIEGLKSSVFHLLSSIHDMALELRPTALDDLGLIPALSQYLKTCPENLGVQVDFEMVGFADDRLDREIETTLYRAIQESLTNVARHAHANKANVLLKKNEQSIAAIVEDHGVGFDSQQVSGEYHKRHHLGLYGMEERIALVGGSLTVESSPGAGTTIYIEVPLKGQ